PRSGLPRPRKMKKKPQISRNNSTQVWFGGFFNPSRELSVNKRVLVTGGCGFIGRYVTSELLENGYQVRVLDSFVEQVHGQGDAAIDPRIELLRGDVRDAMAMRPALDGIDMVVH